MKHRLIESDSGDIFSLDWDSREEETPLFSVSCRGLAIFGDRAVMVQMYEHLGALLEAAHGATQKQ